MPRARSWAVLKFRLLWSILPKPRFCLVPPLRLPRHASRFVRPRRSRPSRLPKEKDLLGRPACRRYSARRARPIRLCASPVADCRRPNSPWRDQTGACGRSVRRPAVGSPIFPCFADEGLSAFLSTCSGVIGPSRPNGCAADYGSLRCPRTGRIGPSLALPISSERASRLSHQTPSSPARNVSGVSANRGEDRKTAHTLYYQIHAIRFGARPSSAP